MKRKIKLIFFDMEGVVFVPGAAKDEESMVASVWRVIPEELGEDAVKIWHEGKRRWLEGKFKNYLEWMEYSIENHRKHGLTKEIFSRIISKVEYMPGVFEAFEELRKKGYKTAIISGGFKNLANRAIRDLGIDHTFVACEYFFDESSGRLVHWNMLPTDYDGKVDFMRLMMREYRISPEECAFVGEGDNDIPLAKEVGMSIAFNGTPALQKAATHAINQLEGKKDLKAILKFFK